MTSLIGGSRLFSALLDRGGTPAPDAGEASDGFMFSATHGERAARAVLSYASHGRWKQRWSIRLLIETRYHRLSTVRKNRHLLDKCEPRLHEYGGVAATLLRPERLASLGCGRGASAHGRSANGSAATMTMAFEPCSSIPITWLVKQRELERVSTWSHTLRKFADRPLSPPRPATRSVCTRLAAGWNVFESLSTDETIRN